MKRYRNIGTAPLGITSPSIEPGSEFSADLDSQQENFLKRIGAIEEIATDTTEDVWSVKEDGE